MKKIRQYEQHAAECRDMARTASSATYRAQLEEMARTWEQLAEGRRLLLATEGKAGDGD